MLQPGQSFSFVAKNCKGQKMADKDKDDGSIALGKFWACLWTLKRVVMAFLLFVGIEESPLVEFAIVILSLVTVECTAR